MKTKITFIVAILFAAHNFYAQITYSNGLVSTGTTTSSGVAAPTLPAQHQWSELQNNAGNTTQTNNYHGFDGYYNGTNTDLRVFDDFTVPFGQSWDINNVDVFCYQQDFLGSNPPIDVLRVRIWSGFPYLGTSTVVSGNMSTNIIDVANSQDMYILRISNTQVPAPGIAPVDTRRIWRIRATITASLTAGIYWIEYQGKSVNNAIFKFIPTTTIGSRGNGNANQYNVIANTFSSLSDTGSPNSAPDIQQNLAFNINYTNPLSNQEQTLDSKIKIYPNPVTDSFFIDFDGTQTIKYDLCDAMGKILKSGETNNSFDCKDLSSGLYILCIHVEGQKVYKKIIKN
jgi:Secretion system C-terminal sorting domain